MLKLIMNRDIVFTTADKESCVPVVKKMIDLAHLARMNGVLALEDVLAQEENVFLKTAITLVVDGVDPVITEHILSNLILADDHKGTQLLERLITAEGITAIQAGENPQVIAMRLYSILGEKYLPSFENTIRELLEKIAVKLRDKKATLESEPFEKLITGMGGRDLQLALSSITNSWTLGYALYGCGFDLICKVLDNLSQNMCVQLCEDILIIENLSEHAVKEAQDEIVEIYQKQQNAGEILPLLHCNKID